MAGIVGAVSAIEIRPLTLDDSAAAVGLLVHLNPECPTPVLRERFERILREHPHFRALGAYRDGRMVGVAGIWVATKIWCGRYLEIDNLVVHPEHRGTGVGTALIEHLAGLARAEHCNLLVLDAYTGNHQSHRLYHRHGFEIWGFHFVRPLGDLNR